MYLLRDKCEGRKRVVMKWGGAGLYVGLGVLALTLLYTTVRHSQKMLDFCNAMKDEGWGIKCSQ